MGVTLVPGRLKGKQHISFLLQISNTFPCVECKYYQKNAPLSPRSTKFPMVNQHYFFDSLIFAIDHSIQLGPLLVILLVSSLYFHSMTILGSPLWFLKLQNCYFYASIHPLAHLTQCNWMDDSQRTNLKTFTLNLNLIFYQLI